MTITAVTPRLRYVGSGTAGPFAYNWKIHAATDLKVYSVVLATGVETLLAYPADYAVAGVGVGAGGTVTLTNVIAATHAIAIVGMPALEQQLNLQNFNDFPAETMEDWLDRIVRMVQFTWDRASRAPYLGETDIEGSGQFDARGNRLSNLGEPVDDDDAVTVAYYEGTFLPQLEAQVALALGYANAADASADAAAASAVLSAGHVVTAAGHVATALGHANAASASATAASGSAVTAAAHVVSAEAARDLAYLWANAAEDAPVSGGEFSAYHWAQKAADVVAGGITAATLSFAPHGNIASVTTQLAIQEVRDDAATALAGHVADVGNPHAVTKAQVGLANADNTSDANKPVSSATQTALNAKASLTGAETLTNKTLTAPIVNDPLVAEKVYTVVDAAGVAIDPNNGSLQEWTLLASRTPTVGAGWANGKSMKLKIADGSAFLITWTTLVGQWIGGSAPTLATTGWTHVELWMEGGVRYGALVGDSA